MPEGKAASGAGRRLMHTRSVECNGYIRDDGLWEVEARLLDVKPFTQAPDGYRDELKPGDPVHDIRLRLAVDDAMKVHEAEATMQATPYPTCIEVEPVLQRLVGESIGKGWREVVPPQDRAARRLHASIGTAGSGGDHAVSDHVLRQGPGGTRLHGQSAQFR